VPFLLIGHARATVLLEQFLIENFIQLSFLYQRVCKQGLMVLSLIGFQHVFWGHFQALFCLNGGGGASQDSYA
jgi:hypothetical protein